MRTAVELHRRRRRSDHQRGQREHRRAAEQKSSRGRSTESSAPPIQCRGSLFTFFYGHPERCVNLNLFTRSESTVSAMDTTGVRHSVCSDSSTHHNTGTQIQHLPLIKHTSLSPRSHRRPPNQPHYVNYEIITDKPPRSPIGGLNTPPRSSHHQMSLSSFLVYRIARAFSSFN